MDALDMAMRMETDAISFYSEAALRTRHLVGRKMFQAVADDEKRHLEMVHLIMNGLHITHADASPIKNLKTAFESMKNEMIRRVEATDDELDAFKIAMNMEREGVASYQHMLTRAGSDKERKLFGRLVQEEQEHYAIFSNTYQFLADTGNWFLWEERGILEGGTHRKEAGMAYTNVALKDKIMEMYPEIGKHGLSLGVVFDEEKSAYRVSFTRGRNSLSTYLEKKDADECMGGVKCVYFGVQIAQFIRNFDEREVFDQRSA